MSRRGGAPRRRGGGGGGQDDLRRLFVYDLLPECEDEDLVRYFSKFGRLEASVCRSKDSDMSHCCGFVWMQDVSTAAAILESKSEHKVWEYTVQVSRQPTEELAALIDDPAAPQRKLAPRRAQPDPAPAPAPGADEAEAVDAVLDPDAEPAGEEKADWKQQRDQGASNGWLFVGKLDGSTNEKDIQAIFSEAGKVQKVELIRDKDGISKKFGFVRMADQATADFILSSGQQFELPPGNIIKVGPYTGKMKGGGSAGGRGGGGGGGGGRRDGGGGGAGGGHRDGWDRDGWDRGSGGGGYYSRDDDARPSDARPSDARYARAPPPPPSRRGDRGRDYGRDYDSDRRGGAYTGGGAYVDDRGGGPVGGGGPIGGGGASRRSRPRERAQPYGRGGSDWR